MKSSFQQPSQQMVELELRTEIFRSLNNFLRLKRRAEVLRSKPHWINKSFKISKLNIRKTWCNDRKMFPKRLTQMKDSFSQMILYFSSLFCFVQMRIQLWCEKDNIFGILPWGQAVWHSFILRFILFFSFSLSFVIACHRNIACVLSDTSLFPSCTRRRLHAGYSAICFETCFYHGST